MRGDTELLYYIRVSSEKPQKKIGATAVPPPYVARASSDHFLGDPEITTTLNVDQSNDEYARSHRAFRKSVRKSVLQYDLHYNQVRGRRNNRRYGSTPTVRRTLQ